MTFGGDFNVSRPQKRYRSPRLRQAATTLCASGRERGGQSCGSRENLNVTHDLKYNFLLNFLILSNMSSFSSLTDRTAVANQGGAMEADTISKNGRSSKSHMSSRNYICLFKEADTKL